MKTAEQWFTVLVKNDLGYAGRLKPHTDAEKLAAIKQIQLDALKSIQRISKETSSRVRQSNLARESWEAKQDAGLVIQDAIDDFITRLEALAPLP